MIDRILERLEELKNNTRTDECPTDKEIDACEKEYSCAACYLECAINIVQEVAKEYGNGWIPCSERLPKNGENILICDSFGHVYQQSWGDCYTVNHYPQAVLGGSADSIIIAWQPLPAPYQKAHSRCDTCTHYVADEVPPICYMCCKGIEDNYQQKGE